MNLFLSLPKILSYPFPTKYETYKITKNRTFYKYLKTEITQKFIKIRIWLNFQVVN